MQALIKTDTSQLRCHVPAVLRPTRTSRGSGSPWSPWTVHLAASSTQRGGSSSAPFGFSSWRRRLVRCCEYSEVTLFFFDSPDSPLGTASSWTVERGSETQAEVTLALTKLLLCISLFVWRASVRCTVGRGRKYLISLLQIPCSGFGLMQWKIVIDQNSNLVNE